MNCLHQSVFYFLTADLLKLVTMMGMGRVMHSTPQMAHSEPTNLPAAVSGATSPYPVLVIVMIAQYRVCGRVKNIVSGSS